MIRNILMGNKQSQLYYRQKILVFLIVIGSNARRPLFMEGAQKKNSEMI